jgi:hypothetical protein
MTPETLAAQAVSEAIRNAVEAMSAQNVKLLAEVQHNYEVAQQAMKDREAAIVERDTRVEAEKRLYVQNDTYLRDQLKAALLQLSEKDEWIKALETRIDTQTKMLADAGIVKLRETEKPKCDDHDWRECHTVEYCTKCGETQKVGEIKKRNDEDGCEKCRHRGKSDQCDSFNRCR